MEFQKFEDLLKRSSSALLLCHHNADPDSICSAYGFLNLLEMINPGIKVEISAPFGISKLSRKILDKLTFKIVSIPNLNADFVCILDTNSIQQLDELKLSLERSNKPIVIIDHHTLRQKNEPAIYFTLIDESATSTCEIVYNFFDKLKKKPSKKVALALFLGIAYDTKHFSIAKAKSFKIIYRLISFGVNVDEAFSMLSTSMDFSEKIARLKAAKRLQIFRIGNQIIVISRVNSFQASVARAILGLGADLAIIGGSKKNLIVVSMRSTLEFYSNTGIHLGRDLAIPLGEFLRGIGGGHSTSAGVNGEGNLESAFSEIISILRKKF